jgi:hypothetical protein
LFDKLRKILFCRVACLKQKSEEMIRAHADQVKNIKDVV